MARDEEALREELHWLRVALGTVGDAVLGVDAGNRVAFMNPWPRP